MKKSLMFAILAVLFLLCSQVDASYRHRNDASEEYLDELTGAKSSNLVEVVEFGSNPGNLKMYKFVPEPEPVNAPLIVACHGTSENAHLYSDRIGWNELAQKYGLIILYPAQTRANNTTLGFRWYSPENALPGKGESGSVREMIENMKQNHVIDEKRIFVTGFSAGASFATALCCNYPDIFCAGAIMSGTPFGCATNLQEGFVAMFKGVIKAPKRWAKLVTDTLPGYEGSFPRLLVFHGDKDRTVNPLNMKELVKQFTALHGSDDNCYQEMPLKDHKYRAYYDNTGSVVVETIEIAGMGHTYAIDPGTETDQGGKPGSFAKEVGIYSAYYCLRSWGLVVDNR